METAKRWLLFDGLSLMSFWLPFWEELAKIERQKGLGKEWISINQSGFLIQDLVESVFYGKLQLCCQQKIIYSMEIRQMRLMGCGRQRKSGSLRL